MDKGRRCLENGTARRRRGRITQPPPTPPPRNLLVVPFTDCPAGVDCALFKTSMILSKGWEGFEAKDDGGPLTGRGARRSTGARRRAHFRHVAVGQEREAARKKGESQQTRGRGDERGSYSALTVRPSPSASSDPRHFAVTESRG
jgi:hypothetical protein